MPTYEYICDACQYEFEKFQSIKADPIATCPECGKDHVRRKISSGAGILFKGGGFYETDYRSASYTEAAKKDSGNSTGENKPAESTATKSETAPKADAPKAEPKPAATKAADTKAAS